jgi:tetratricopeptide (TPR) repeat protein
LPLVLAIALTAQQQSSSSTQSSGNSSQSNVPASNSSGSDTRGPAANSAPSNPPGSTSTPAKTQTPDLRPPRSDRVNVGDLGSDIGESSSKDTQVDLSPPADDSKKHPESSESLSDAEAETSGGTTVGEFHPWDPHKAAKDVEVGDFYFKRKNYHGAEDRYREALYYKENDAIATFRLAVCLEKMGRSDEALAEYEGYLKILPHGPEASEAERAIDRLRGTATNAKKVK